ncbi:hypothetical protein EV589_4402 [Mycobacterium sp. BK558]|nr:hypothetical protein EV589_4402 [Mycobacterium sp. BK558]
MAGGQVIIDEFDGPDGLITAEGQPVPPAEPWLMTSGSLFRDNGTGWSGVPDDATGSAVFRMVSVERDFDDVDLAVTLRVDDLSTTNRTPAQQYDGAHIWLRYESDRTLYAVSVDRRDGTMIIKKKCAGGTDNGGTYYDLNGKVSPAPIPFGQWQQVNVSARDQPDGSVRITADRDGMSMEGVDTGVGCPPLRSGGVGIRGDNAELRFARIDVQPR